MKRLLLAPLLIVLVGCSLNKYSSRKQASNACKNWLVEGGTYTLKKSAYEIDVPIYGKLKYEDLSDEELMAKIKSGPFEMTDRYYEQRFKEMRIEREKLPQTRKKLIPEETRFYVRRQCELERDTNQYLGYELPVSKGKVTYIDKCKRRFYKNNTDDCFDEYRLRNYEIKKNFYY